MIDRYFWFAGKEKNSNGASGSALKTLDAPIRANVKSGVNPGQTYSGAVISTESVHVTLDRGSLNRSVSSTHEGQGDAPDSVSNLRTVDLRDTPNGRSTSNTGVIRQGFG